MSQATVNGANLFYEVTGDGPPLMMMHGGLGLDHTYFLPWFNQLSDIAQLIFYDHRGNGRSDRSINYEEITLGLFAEDARRLTGAFRPR